MMLPTTSPDLGSTGKVGANAQGKGGIEGLRIQDFQWRPWPLDQPHGRLDLL